MVAIESEVKSMEKKVAKIKAILLSKEIFDFSPEEHLKHGEVCMDHFQKLFFSPPHNTYCLTKNM